MRSFPDCSAGPLSFPLPSRPGPRRQLSHSLGKRHCGQHVAHGLKLLIHEQCRSFGRVVGEDPAHLDAFKFDVALRLQRP